MPRTTFVLLILSFVIFAAACGSGGGDPPPTPDGLPGEFVDIVSIYGQYPDGAGHVDHVVDYEADGNSNPPAGGPHWGSTGCPGDPAAAPLYCGPAPWGIYREPWPPETLVHNMEHGGAVVWYNMTDSAIVEELEELVLSKLQTGDILVMAPYPDMEAEHVALTSWARIEKFPVSEYTKQRVEDFIDTHVRRFNPENF